MTQTTDAAERSAHVTRGEAVTTPRRNAILTARLSDGSERAWIITVPPGVTLAGANIERIGDE